MEGCVYLITCLVNNKKYVGKWHLPTPEKRFYNHIRSANRGSKLLLHCAIRKHGVENFKFELICTCPLESCCSIEEYYAEQYGCYKWDPEPGYNMVWCGDKSFLGLKHKPESIQKMREAKVGKVMSEESSIKKSLAMKGRKQSEAHVLKRAAARTGKGMSDIGRAKVSEAAKNRPRRPHSEQTRENMRLAWVRRKTLKDSLTPVENGTPLSATNDICSRVGE
jgi:group I intron endonuclease